MSGVGTGQSVTKYSKEFSIPQEFPDILRDLTREILRHQPKDINRFGMFLFINYSYPIDFDLSLFYFILFIAYDYFSNELQNRTADDNS